ncbi:MAG: nucleoside hydrolase [Candidatus Limnocylindrus sp.]
MAATRRIWVDTDTASDDAVALVMAFKNPGVEVAGISVVAGNVPLPQATQIALYTAEICGAKVPIHAGADRAIVRSFVTAQNVHGSDGMGDIGLPLHGRTPTSTAGVEALIDAFRKSPGQMDLVTLGPLTNVALAVRAEPKFASWVRRCVMMGGTGVLPGNVTPLAEFNFWVDPEAAQIVFESGMPLEMVGWDVSVADAVISDDLAAEIRAIGPLGEYVVDPQRVLREFCRTETKLNGFDLPDPIAMAVAIEPDMVTKEATLRVEISLGTGHERGQTIVDHLGGTKRAPNCRVVYRVDRERFIKMLKDACVA